MYNYTCVNILSLSFAAMDIQTMWIRRKSLEKGTAMLGDLSMVDLFGTNEIDCTDAPVNSRPTPLKINMEHNHGGLEDHFPF